MIPNSLIELPDNGAQDVPKLLETQGKPSEESLLTVITQLDPQHPTNARQSFSTETSRELIGAKRAILVNHLLTPP